MMKNIPKNRIRVITFIIQEIIINEGNLSLGTTKYLPYEPTVEVRNNKKFEFIFFYF